MGLDGGLLPLLLQGRIPLPLMAEMGLLMSLMAMMTTCPPVMQLIVHGGGCGRGCIIAITVHH